MLKVLSFIGTRPEAIKMAPVVSALGARQETIRSIVCATGQHRELLAPLLAHFGIRPDVDLEVMAANQSLPALTARIVGGVEPLIARCAPDWVLVQGDTTTVMAVSLVAYQLGVRVAHIEAGLRSGDRWQPFPEEVNRRVATLTSALHFAPTAASRANLLREGIHDADIVVTGNTSIDTLLGAELPATWPAELLPDVGDRRLVVVTAHRRENHGAGLRGICEGVRRLAVRYGDRLSVVFPVHPNPAVVDAARAGLADVPSVRLTPPIDYPAFVPILKRADVVLTDSGGLQEECPSLGKPVLVLRETTERPEAVAAGAARLVGCDPDRIVAETSRLLDDDDAYRHMAVPRHLYGDGNAAQRIVETLVRAGRSATRIAGATIANTLMWPLLLPADEVAANTLVSVLIGAGAAA